MRRSVAELRTPAYPAAEAGLLRMDANTNLAGINPAIERTLAAGAWKDANQYPSGLNDELRNEVARAHNLAPDEIMIGAGSDEIIDTIVKTFCNPGDVVAAPVPTFVMYEFYAKVNAAAFKGVPLGPNWRLEPDLLFAARAKVVFLASPNNPTGNAHGAEAIERVIRGNREGIVVVDEAYADFCGQDFLRRIRQFPNLVVIRTFSKSHGLAGLRVGYGAANRDLMQRLMSSKAPFTVSAVSERIAAASLQDRAFLDETLRMVAEEKPFLSKGLSALGFQVWPSDANFLLVDARRPVKPLAERVRSKGVLVRSMAETAGLETCFRTTIGRREHNERLLMALGEALRD